MVDSPGRGGAPCPGDSAINERILTVLEYALAHLRALAVIAGLGLVLLLVLLFGPPRLFEYSESPGFCGKCHPPEYAAWEKMGSHRQKRCIDCHLPNDGWFEHFVWKGIDGTKDMSLFAVMGVSENIELTGHGVKVARVNCVRCHEDMTSKMDRTRQCWDCHRRVTHLGAAAPITR
ncbi:MAG: NapC/NirT family cytochrome c [Elusimicrobiota bacterium]